MSTFPDQATLHPQTVQQIAEDALNQQTILVEDKIHEVHLPKPGEITKHIKVRDDLWAFALAEADGDWKRLQPISDVSVIVHNRPWRKK